MTDTLVTDNFCLLRLVVNKKLYDQIIEMREVAHVDRPPRVKIEAALDIGLPELHTSGPPPRDAQGILVIDSGVKHHPLLADAIGGEIAVTTSNGKIAEDKTDDDAGHGTKVASIALYGDIQHCIDNKKFEPKIWIYSAKVMFRDDNGDAVFDPNELLEHQLKKAVLSIINKHPKCKIINLSLGNSAHKMFTGQRQFSIASQIDELAAKHGLIFVVSAGNNDEDVSPTENYPDYLLEDSRRVKIIDPASSAHAITVGALFKHARNGAVVEFPSQFTRVGPGLRNMIKPELVEYGGGHGDEIVTINPRWIPDGRLFTLDKGTSFSAPKVAHYLAILKNNYPTMSNNMIKALLLSSARIPDERPGKLAELELYGSVKDAAKLLNVYGYGKPRLEHALFSDDSRVLLLYDGEIDLNGVHFFTISLPDSFIREKGDRSITVTLVFDPPVNRNRLDYLGVTMEAHLFKNKDISEIQMAYSSKSTFDNDNTEDVVPANIRKFEVKLSPGVNLRKRCIHQKATIQFRKKPDVDSSRPLVLAVVCQNRWIEEKVYHQPYAVIVSIEHSAEIDLYNQIRVRNRERTRLRG